MSSAMRKAWQQLQWSLAHRGAGGTARVVLERVSGSRGKPTIVRHPFDVEHDVDTSGLIGGGSLASGAANDRYNVAYHGVPPSRMRDALERWLATPGTGAIEEYAFADLGCGKGRAMMLASEMPFREVVGVELNAGLMQLAEENLRRWKELGRMRSPVRFVLGDASEVVLAEPPLLMYLYNSFHAPVLRALLKRIDAAAGERKGSIDLLYLVPEHAAVFEEFPRFECVWNETIRTSEEDAAIDLVASSKDRCILFRR